MGWRVLQPSPLILANSCRISNPMKPPTMKHIGGTSVLARGPLVWTQESAKITADIEVINGIVW